MGLQRTREFDASRTRQTRTWPPVAELVDEHYLSCHDSQARIQASVPEFLSAQSRALRMATDVFLRTEGRPPMGPNQAFNLRWFSGHGHRQLEAYVQDATLYRDPDKGEAIAALQAGEAAATRIAARVGRAGPAVNGLFAGALELVQQRLLKNTPLVRCLGPALMAAVDTYLVTGRVLEEPESALAGVMREPLNADHPGLKDPKYLAQRMVFERIAAEHVYGTEAEIVTYTPHQDRGYAFITQRLEEAHERFACAEYLESKAAFLKAGFPTDRVPQLAEVSQMLTGMHRDRPELAFRLEPVPGLVPTRRFLGALDDGIFLSTQYLRYLGDDLEHALYTYEPDVVHELIGHLLMLRTPMIAELAKLFGRAAKVARDALELTKLGRLYWFTIEFGVVRENGTIKSWGAGSLSSFGEMMQLNRHFREYGEAGPNTKDALTKRVTALVERVGGVDALASRWAQTFYQGMAPDELRSMIQERLDEERRGRVVGPQIVDFDPDTIWRQGYDVTDYQPVLFAGDSLEAIYEQLKPWLVVFITEREEDGPEVVAPGFEPTAGWFDVLVDGVLPGDKSGH